MANLVDGLERAIHGLGVEFPVDIAGKSLGGGNTMFIEISDIDTYHDEIKDRVKIVLPIVTQWYGMREFAIEDPDGYVITFAEPVGR